MTMESQANQIQTCLSQTFDPINRKQAELNLEQLEQLQQFGPTLLSIIQSEQIDSNIRFAASVYFKNFVKRNWSENLVLDGDRITMKNGIIQLMVNCPIPLQLQLSEVYELIGSKFDCRN